jgi:6-phospho-beta-glucosidase
MKIALLGGGGFRTPLAYAALESIAERARVSELVLHDVAADRLEHMRLVLDGLAEDSSRRLPVRVTTDLEDAVRGADFVWCAIRVGGLEGRLIDQNVPVREGVVGQETTGPGGICFALRSLPVLLDIARTVARAAPRAWFINFTNPVGLTTEALQQVLGSRVIGVCDTPTGLCRRVARLLDRAPCQVWFDYFGLNHLGWLRAVTDEAGDCLPTLLADADRLSQLQEARLFGVARLREIGMIPNEYLYYYECAAGAVDAVRHGRGRAEYLLKQQHAFYAERFATPRQAVSAWRTAWRERERTYMAEAAPKENAAEPNHPAPTEGYASNVAAPNHAEPTEGYARVAVDLLEALAGNTRRVMILNTANHGSLPSFDARAVVEVPCVVGSHGVTPVAVGEVPTEARSLMQQIKHVERLTIKAALEGSAAYAVEALAAHPLVGSMLIAQRIFDGYRAEHGWLRARFGAG